MGRSDETNERESNIKYYGRYSLMKDSIVQMRYVKEILRVIDSKEEESKQAKKKLEYKLNFVDLEARNSFQANKVTTSVIKCAHGFNHYGLRHSMINEKLIEANCPRCNQIETWDHVVWCSDTVRLRREFITELLLDLLAEKNDEVSIDNIMSFGEDIVRYLEYEEDEDEYETNQWLIGMKELFRGYIVKVWFGININSDIYRALNKVVVRKCVEFYVKCWKYRNEAYHDIEK